MKIPLLVSQMTKLRCQKFFLPSLGLLLVMLGCVPIKQSTSSRGEKSQRDQSSDDANSEAAESEAISPPVPITGSYLHCEIDSKEIATTNRAEVGCRVDDGSSSQKIDLAQIYQTANFLYQLPANPNISVSAAPAAVNSPFHVLYSFQSSVEALPMEALENFMVMFRANPRTAQPNQFIFSARLAKANAPALLLPDNFPVYYSNGTVINNPAPGFERRILPTVNHTYPAIDGCYIACYSNSATESVYAIEENTYVMGQVRVKGYYAGRLCQGDGFQDIPNIADIPEYKAACGQFIPACAGNICWGGNDTGGWFGFQ